MKRTITVSPELIEKKALENKKVYLSDILTLDQMYNTVFNKAVTGIGGTSLALDSDKDIIILMPFKEVVNNKEGYNKEVFTVKEGVTQTAILNYLKTTKVRKIVSTYDGLSKLLKAYLKAKIDIYDDFLLVDEWQVIFHQYLLRKEVMNLLLSEVKYFSKVCFMTATPIKKEWYFDEMNHLDELELVYELPLVEVKHINVRSIEDEAAAICRLYLTKVENAHIFCNSVDFINKVTKSLNLNKVDVRIVCSKSNEKNASKLSGYKIESTLDPVKKINFYTSTCFEGCDIFDKNGKIFVMCDGSKAHTLVDISTTLGQIGGRIRDIKDNSIDLIYRQSRYVDVTKEQFETSTQLNIKKAEELIAEKESAFINFLDIDKLNSVYLNTEVVDGKVVIKFEKILLNIDCANFELQHTYSIKANLIAELNNTFSAVTIVKPWAEQLEKLEAEKVSKLSFREKCELYKGYLEDNSQFKLDVEFDKTVVKAFEVLGYEVLERLSFHKGNIENALISKSDLSETNKIFKLIKSYEVRTGSILSNSDAKLLITGIYNQLGIKKAPSATHIENYFNVEKVDRTIDSKRIKGYKIISSKAIFKD